MELVGLIEVGMVGEEFFQVEMAHTAAQVGSGPALSQDGALEVMSTPSLIAFMERVSFRMLEARLPDDLTSVGVSVQVSHKAPTLVGEKVRLRAEVSAVEGRRVALQLQAWDELELVGEGTHQRVIIDRESFIQRLLVKRDR
jgi:fluoroacetyl-CoA thioesterase